MISIADTLALERIRLELRSTDPEEAKREAAGLLQSAPEVLDWESLQAGILRSAPCLNERSSEFGICLPHARTDAVKSMVMSVGRSSSGIRFPQLAVPVRYIFCIAVPKALDSDYLRIVGSLTRILKNGSTEAELRVAGTADEFIEVLTRLETEL